jgi:hypothetical protein
MKRPKWAACPAHHQKHQMAKKSGNHEKGEVGCVPSTSSKSIRRPRRSASMKRPKWVGGSDIIKKHQMATKIGEHEKAEVGRVSSASSKSIKWPRKSASMKRPKWAGGRDIKKHQKARLRPAREKEKSTQHPACTARGPQSIGWYQKAEVGCSRRIMD